MDLSCDVNPNTDVNPQPTHSAPSPFLSGTKIQWALDSTSLTALKTCPRYYKYSIIDGWVPREESIHLRFGIEYHAAIQDYEVARATGQGFDEAVNTAVGKLLVRSRDFDPAQDTYAGRYKNPSTLRQLVVDYFDHYRTDPCTTLILSNSKPAVELSFRFELDWTPDQSTGQPYVLCGHLDRVVTYNDDTFVLDHKTTTSQPTDYYFQNFSPNNQMTLYAFAGQVVLNSPVRGVIVEAAQVLLDKPNRFARGFAYRSDQIIHEWLTDLEVILVLAKRYADADHWPMNDTACGMYGGCKFRSVCSKNPEVRQHYLKADFIQLSEEDRWNPLKAR